MRVTPVALVVLVLVAGCSAAPTIDDPDSATSTATPVEVPPDYDYAPGLTTEGVTEPATLAAAHERVLDGSSFRLTATRTVRYANGTLREQLEVDVAVADDRTYLASAATHGPNAPVFLGRPPANGTYWSNGSVYVRKLTRDDETTYNEFEGPNSGAGTWQYWSRTVPFGGEQATPGGFYRDVFASIPVRIDSDTETEGHVFYRVSGTSLTDSRFDDEVTDVREPRLIAVVRDDGLVVSLTLQYEGEVDGSTVQVVQHVEYGSVGETTAERPPWFEKAVGG